MNPDPDLTGSGLSLRSDPDLVKIGPDPQHCHGHRIRKVSCISPRANLGLISGALVLGNY